MAAGEAADGGSGTVEGGVYRVPWTVRSCDVDFRRALRPSRLVELVQEAAIAHVERAGCGRARTLDRGILWVVAERCVRVDRWPCYGDRIVVESWPGAMRHVLFPRFDRVLDARGRVLAASSSLWMLVDARTRRMVFPSACGVSIDGVARADVGEEPPLARVAARPTDHAVRVTASYALCDMNGHMNNARFVDLVEDALAGPIAGSEVAAFSCAYEAEVPCGSALDLAWREDGSGAYAEGAVEGKPAFRMELSYR